MVSAVLIVSTIILIVIVIAWTLNKFKVPKPKSKKSFGTMSQTNRGETVRSKAEKQVADYLHDQEIDYVYEQTIVLGRKKRKIKYDFFLPESKIYIEYWGLEGASGDIGKQYVERKEEKIKLYDKFNLKLVSLYPEDLNYLEQTIPKKMNEAKRSQRSIWKKIKRFILYSLFYYEVPSEDGVNDTSKSSEQTKKEFCVNCGEELDLGSKFCFECGSSI